MLPVANVKPCYLEVPPSLVNHLFGMATATKGNVDKSKAFV